MGGFVFQFLFSFSISLTHLLLNRHLAQHGQARNGLEGVNQVVAVSVEYLPEYALRVLLVDLEQHCKLLWPQRKGRTKVMPVPLLDRYDVGQVVGGEGQESGLGLSLANERGSSGPHGNEIWPNNLTK